MKLAVFVLFTMITLPLVTAKSAGTHHSYIKSKAKRRKCKRGFKKTYFPYRSIHSYSASEKRGNILYYLHHNRDLYSELALRKDGILRRAMGRETGKTNNEMRYNADKFSETSEADEEERENNRAANDIAESQQLSQQDSEEEEEVSPQVQGEKEISSRVPEEKESSPQGAQEKELSPQGAEEKELSPQGAEENELSPQVGDEKEVSPQVEEDNEISPQFTDGKVASEGEEGGHAEEGLEASDVIPESSEDVEEIDSPPEIAEGGSESIESAHEGNVYVPQIGETWQLERKENSVPERVNNADVDGSDRIATEQDDEVWEADNPVGQSAEERKKKIDDEHAVPEPEEIGSDVEEVFPPQNRENYNVDDDDGIKEPTGFITETQKGAFASDDNFGGYRFKYSRSRNDMTEEGMSKNIKNLATTTDDLDSDDDPADGGKRQIIPFEKGKETEGIICRNLTDIHTANDNYTACEIRFQVSNTTATNVTTRNLKTRNITDTNSIARNVSSLKL